MVWEVYRLGIDLCMLLGCFSVEDFNACSAIDWFTDFSPVFGHGGIELLKCFLCGNYVVHLVKSSWTPHFFYFVEFSDFRTEDMNHDVTCVQNYPVTSSHAFCTDIFYASYGESFTQFFCYSYDLSG